MVSEPSLPLDGGKMVTLEHLQQMFEQWMKLQERRGTKLEFQQHKETRPEEPKLKKNVDKPLGNSVEQLVGVLPTEASVDSWTSEDPVARHTRKGRRIPVELRYYKAWKRRSPKWDSDFQRGFHKVRKRKSQKWDSDFQAKVGSQFNNNRLARRFGKRPQSRALLTRHEIQPQDLLRYGGDDDSIVGKGSIGWTKSARAYEQVNLSFVSNGKQGMEIHCYGNKSLHIWAVYWYPEVFKTFSRKKRNKTLYLEVEHEQKVKKLISFWDNRVWEPGGESFRHYELKWLENGYKRYGVLWLMQKLQKKGIKWVMRWMNHEASTMPLQIAQCLSFHLEDKVSLFGASNRMWRVMFSDIRKTHNRDDKSELSLTNQMWEPGGVSFKQVQWDLLEKVYKHDKVWGLLERFHDTCLVEILKTFSHSAKDAHVDSLNKGIKILFSSKVDLGKLIQREEICFGDKENQKVGPIDTATMKSEESELMFPLIQEVYIILVHFSFGTSCYSGAQEMSESSYIMRDQLDGARNESGLGTEMFEASNVIPMKRYARKNDFRVYGSTSSHMVTLFVISVARSNGKSDEFSAYSKLPVREYLGYIEGVISYGKCSELLWFILSLSVYNFGGSSLDFNNKNHDLDGMKETLKMTTKDGRLSNPPMLDTIILLGRTSKLFFIYVTDDATIRSSENIKGKKALRELNEAEADFHLEDKVVLLRGSIDTIQIMVIGPVGLGWSLWN